MKRILTLYIVIALTLLVFTGCSLLESNEYKDPQQLLINYPTQALPLPDNAFVFSQEEKEGEIIVWYGIEDKDMSGVRAFYINYLNNTNYEVSIEDEQSENLITCSSDNYNFDIRIQQPDSAQAKEFQSITKIKVKFKDNTALNNDSQPTAVNVQPTAEPAEQTLSPEPANQTTAAPTAAPTNAPATPTAQPTNTPAPSFNENAKILSKTNFMAYLTKDTWVYAYSADGPDESSLGYIDIAPRKGQTIHIEYDENKCTMMWYDINTGNLLNKYLFQYAFKDGMVYMQYDTTESNGITYTVYSFMYINEDGYLVQSAKVYDPDKDEYYNMSNYNVYEYMN